MKKIFQTLVLSVAVAATTLVAVSPASADEWRRRHHHGNWDGGGDDAGDAVAAGVAGLAVGALLGSALSAPRSTRTYIDEDTIYDEPQPVYRRPAYVYRPAPVYRQQRVIVTDQGGYYQEQPRLRPWTRSWMRYCTKRYRSFDPGSGTFIGNDGREHFCAG